MPQKAAESKPPLPAAEGWQIIAWADAKPADRCLEQEYALADAVGVGACKPTVFIWRSRQALIVTRGQTHWPGFAATAAALAERGWPVVARRSGGGAFPIGLGTIQIAMVQRNPGFGLSIETYYERLGALIIAALREFGIAAQVGATPGAFCNGRHDLVIAGRKVAGLAQHWRPCGDGERCVTAAASVLVEADMRELTAIVDLFHAGCGQTIDIRVEAMTTVRDHCAAAAPRGRDLAADFLAQLAAAAGRQPTLSVYS